MEQLSKAIKLLSVLNRKGKIDSSILAEELGVSLRTAQRYLQELSRLVPVQIDNKGRKNEYYLMENYSFKDSLLSNSEINMLSSLLDYAKTFMGSENAGLLDLIKLKVFHANTYSQPYYIMRDEAVDIQKISDIRIRIDELINKQKVIDFYYKRKNKKYRVEPYKIVYSEGFWYLVAQHDEKIKTFLLDYIEDIRETRDYYSRVPKDLISSLNEQRSIWFNQEPKERVEVEIKSDVAEYFERKNFLFEQKILEKKNNGNLVIEFYVSGEHDFFHQIIKWFPHFKVLCPGPYKKIIEDSINIFLEFNNAKQQIVT